MTEKEKKEELLKCIFTKPSKKVHHITLTEDVVKKIKKCNKDNMLVSLTEEEYDNLFSSLSNMIVVEYY